MRSLALRGLCGSSLLRMPRRGLASIITTYEGRVEQICSSWPLAGTQRQRSLGGNQRLCFKSFKVEQCLTTCVLNFTPCAALPCPDRLEDADLDDHNFDVSVTPGVLKVTVPKTGTFVMNTHGVTRQIWLSSPLSGPHKFNFHRDRRRWLGERDMHSLHDRLVREFSQATGTDIRFEKEF